MLFPYGRRLARMLEAYEPHSRLICFVGEGASPGAPASGGEGSGPVTPPAGGQTSPTPPAGGQVPVTPPQGVQTSEPPKTLTLTEAEFQARMNQVAGSVRREVRDQFGGDPEEIKAKLDKLNALEAEKLTEAQRLEKERDDEKAARARAEAENATLRIENTLGRYIASQHPAYLGKEEWITPKILVALGDKKPTPQNIEAAVKEAVDAFVQAVPIAQTPGNRDQPGAQPGPPRSGAPGAQQATNATKEALGYLQGAGFHGVLPPLRQ